MCLIMINIKKISLFLYLLAKSRNNGLMSRKWLFWTYFSVIYRVFQIPGFSLWHRVELIEDAKYYIIVIFRIDYWLIECVKFNNFINK